MDSSQMVVPALSRPFTLGMLYDAQRDALITGLTLWDEKTLQGKKSESSGSSNNFVITESDSIESKSTLLGVDDSLKVSVFCGLIEVGGSAKYLKDHKEFENQSRVTGHYKSITRLEQLSMTDLMTLEYNQRDLIIKSSATHIVTGILYGANAFFVFDSEKLDSSSVEEIQGTMKAMVTKFPSISQKGDGEIKQTQLTEEEKALSAKVSCKFFGDFTLQSIPLTFEEAVKTFGQLPQLLGENGEKAVPMKVWLMPLTTLCPEPVELTSEMGLVCGVSVQCYLAEEKMVKKVPSPLEKNIENRSEYPFSQEKLIILLDDKEREINVIKSCVDIMKGTKIVKNQSELDREVLAADVDDAFCFVFTSTKWGVTYLDEMATYLDSPRMESTTEDEWFYSDEVLTSMKQKAKAFQDFTKAQKNNNRIRFLIAVIPNEKYKGATIYHYNQGRLVREYFSEPDLYPEKITDRRDLMLYACDLTLDPNTVQNYLVLSDGNKKVTSGSTWHQYPDNPERFDKYTQVLCREGLSGRHYWEVELDNAFFIKCIYVAVAYATIKRKGCRDELGKNTLSWVFGQGGNCISPVLQAWHNGNEWQSPLPSGGCSTLGVYLDWPAGTLSFYKISFNTLTHLYTFHTTFTGAVYAGFWVYYKGNYAYLRPLK